MKKNIIQLDDSMIDSESIYHNNESLNNILNKKIEETEWKQVSLANGITTNSFNDNRGIQYKKIGNRVHLWGFCQGAWNGSDYLILTKALPEEYQPHYYFYQG